MEIAVEGVEIDAGGRVGWLPGVTIQMAGWLDWQHSLCF